MYRGKVEQASSSKIWPKYSYKGYRLVFLIISGPALPNLPISLKVLSVYVKDDNVFAIIPSL